MTLLVLFTICIVSAELMAQGERGGVASTLDTIVVTSSRGQESLREVSSHVTVIDEKQLDIIPFDTLSGILRHEGFHIRDYPGQGTAAVDIRGFRTATVGNDGGLGGRVLLLVDGRPAGTGNLYRIMKSNIETVEIIRGPAAVQYGTAAMGGVINVITKKGQGDLSVRAKAGFGSFSFNDQTIGMDFRQGPVDFALGLYRTRNNDIEDGNGQRLYNTLNHGIYTGSLNIGYNFMDDRQRLGMTAGFYDNNYQGTSGSHSYGPITPNDIGGSNVVNKNTSFDFLYTGANERGALSWQTRYYHITDKYESHNSHRRDLRPYSTDTKMDGIQAQMKAAFDTFELTAGLDWLKYATERFSQYDLPTRALKNYKMSNYAAFFIGKLKFLEDSLIFNAGVRYDNFENDATGNTIKEHNVSPSAGIVFIPIDWLKIRANYSKGFRTPTPTEVAQVYQSGATLYLGNPDLSPEKSDTYELGLDFNFDYFSSNITYFYTKYKNEIRSGRRLPPNISTYYNAPGESTYAGFEFGANLYLGSLLGQEFELEPYVKATLYTTREAVDATGKKVAGYYMPHSLAAGINFDYPKYEFSSNLNVSYFARAYEQNFGYNYGAKTVVKAPAYTLVDLSLKKTLFSIGEKSKISMDVAVRNLFDEYYEPILDYAGQGRSFYVGITYSYN